MAIFFSEKADQSAENFWRDEFIVKLSRNLIIFQKIFEKNFKCFEHLVDDDHRREPVDADRRGGKIEEKDEAVALENENDVDLISYVAVFCVADNVDFVRINIFFFAEKTVDNLKEQICQILEKTFDSLLMFFFEVFRGFLGYFLFL